jgi:hypothetical protein
MSRRLRFSKYAAQLQGGRQSALVEGPELKHGQARHATREVGQTEVAFPRRRTRRHDELAVSSIQVVEQRKQRQLPGVIAGDTIDVIDAHDLAIPKSLQYAGPRSRQHIHRQIDGSVAGPVAHGLQQVRLARRG